MAGSLGGETGLRVLRGGDEAGSSARARCWSSGPRCAVRGSARRHATFFAPPSTTRRESEPAASQIERTLNSSPPVRGPAATGVCVRARESLTASEDRTAGLAADGLTNREIAQR
jgi:hypothetical protein